jgi:hypothetical protein
VLDASRLGTGVAERAEAVPDAADAAAVRDADGRSADATPPEIRSKLAIATNSATRTAIAAVHLLSGFGPSAGSGWELPFR